MSAELASICLLLLKKNGRLKKSKASSRSRSWGLGRELGDAVFSVENCCLIGYKNLVKAVYSVSRQTSSCACSGSALTFLALQCVLGDEMENPSSCSASWVCKAWFACAGFALWILDFFADFSLWTLLQPLVMPNAPCNVCRNLELQACVTVKLLLKFSIAFSHS